MNITKEELKAMFTEFTTGIRQEIADQNRITIDIMRQETKAIIKHEVSILRQEMQNMEQHILYGVAEILSESVHPQLDDHERRILILEKR